MAKNWRDEFDARQRKQIEWAEKYVNETDDNGDPMWKHGANGHNDLVIIGTMAALLDKVQRVLNCVPEGGALLVIDPDATPQQWEQALKRLNDLAPFRIEEPPLE